MGHLIKVNFPLNEENYRTGNGEGMWVEVDDKAKHAYDTDAVGGLYTGTLANDSCYYPGLGCGDTVVFEMRGIKRPCADFPNFLSKLNRLTEAGKIALIQKIAENGGAENG